MTEARVVLEDWRWKYNHIRPHCSLGYINPSNLLQKIMKLVIPFLALALLTEANAQSYSPPSGFVKVTVAGAPAGEEKLTAISITLPHEVEFSDSFNIGSHTSGSQLLTYASSPSNPAPTWTSTQWTGSPYLAYVEANDNDGDTTTNPPQEAFLISANTTDGGLTLASSFDLTSRFPATTQVTIRKAHTIGSLFGTTGAEVSFKKSFFPNNADNLYVWNGSIWVTYYHNGTEWKKSPSDATVASENVIFPDEGIYVNRKSVDASTASTDLTLTFFGNVPISPQVSTVPGNSLSFVSSRYPVNPTGALQLTIDEMGFDDLPNWKTSFFPNNADKVYVWTTDGAFDGWTTYYKNTSGWQASAPAGSSRTVSTPIPANVAMLVERVDVDTDADSGVVSPLPYVAE